MDCHKPHQPYMLCYKPYSQGRINCTRGPGQSRDREAPKLFSATAQRFTCPRYNFAKAPTENLKTDTIWQPRLQRQLGVTMYGSS